MASIRNSPCAKFTISMSPKIRLRPTARGHRSGPSGAADDGLDDEISRHPP
jgi:hypothetical protein